MRLIELTRRPNFVGWGYELCCLIFAAVDTLSAATRHNLCPWLVRLLSQRKTLFSSRKRAYVLLSLLSHRFSILRRVSGSEEQGEGYARTKGHKYLRRESNIYKYIYIIYLGKVYFWHSNLGRKWDESAVRSFHA